MPAREVSRERLRVLLLAALLGACGETPSLTDGPSPRYAPELFAQVLATVTAPELLPVDGDWPGDYGDANHYGPGFFFRYGEAAGNSAQIQLAEELHAHNVFLVDDAIESPVRLLEDPENLLMSGFGLIEAYARSTDPTNGQRIRNFLDLIDIFMEDFDYYPESFDIIYGPTTINGALALLNLEFAMAARDHGVDASDRVDKAEEIIASGAAIAYGDALGYYRLAQGEDSLYLYPNIMQILAHIRAFQLTDDSAYLDRACALHASIQPLKVEGEGRYRSPYSAAVMGASSDDYTTLSSQNYATLALALLFQVTREQRFRQEVVDILAFIETHLLLEGRALHHWIDGEIARPTDPEYYCTGCNLQLLYVIWRLEEMLAD